jgi:hypothetical protein
MHTAKKEKKQKKDLAEAIRNMQQHKQATTNVVKLPKTPLIYKLFFQ